MQSANTFFQHFRPLIFKTLRFAEGKAGILMKHWAHHRRRKPDVDFSNARPVNNRGSIFDPDSSSSHDLDAATGGLNQLCDRVHAL